MLDVVEAVRVDWAGGFTDFLRDRAGWKTVEAYTQDVRVFAKWFEGANGMAFQPEMLNSMDLRGWRRHSLEVEQVAPATWNRRRASIRALCGWALGAGLISYDPSVELEGAEAVELPPRWLERGELARLLRQCELEIQTAMTECQRYQAVLLQAMVMMMAFAGLREGEVVELDLGDVEITERKGKVRVRLGKGEKFRSVPLNAEVRRALRMWLELRPKWAAAMFADGSGKRVATRSIQRQVKELGRKAGVEVTPHDLRHTFAKRLLDEGAPLTTVQKLLGHSRLETTARYVQPGWADFEKAVERI